MQNSRKTRDKKILGIVKEMQFWTLSIENCDVSRKRGCSSEFARDFLLSRDKRTRGTLNSRNIFFPLVSSLVSSSTFLAPLRATTGRIPFAGAVANARLSLIFYDCLKCSASHNFTFPCSNSALPSTLTSANFQPAAASGP